MPTVDIANGQFHITKWSKFFCIMNITAYHSLYYVNYSTNHSVYYVNYSTKNKVKETYVETMIVYSYIANILNT